MINDMIKNLTIEHKKYMADLRSTIKRATDSWFARKMCESALKKEATFSPIDEEI